MAKNHMKRCSVSLIISKTQAKTTKRYRLIPVRMATIKKSANSASMETGVLASFSIMVSSGYMPNSGIWAYGGSYGGYSPTFLRTLHPVVYSGCIFAFLPTV